MCTDAQINNIDQIYKPKTRFYIKISESKQTYLTKKEVDIVLQLMDGKRAKEIAWKLGSSLHTVNTHLANIKDKLKCANIFQLGLTLGRFSSELNEFKSNQFPGVK